ncbi:hypothetical protein DFH07DRAFT_945809 [Mycena maculata]|uniref:BTB domain-containing protein n=1 Tax=Mycena maculata TaxID=230809 RepID=A0AAD7HTK6_9AGAR|nr:hypothetical protein DFH07DRAFT_945809 [Mycena maculata]
MPSETSAPAYHPLFSDPAADTVLQSIEGTLFRVPRFVLRSTAGYFFATLSAAADAQVVPLPDHDSEVVCVLCMLCGLAPPAPLADWGAAEDALALAERWDAPGAVARVRDALTGPAFLAEPLRLYAHAVRFGWEEEARVAARATLALSLYDDAHRTVLARVPPRNLLALLGLHRRRRDALDRMLSGEVPEGVTSAALGGRCAACGLDTDNYAWREFRARIFAEMDRRPLGDSVTGFAVEEWREALACWNSKCGGSGCGQPSYDRDSILRQIKACIDKLPDAVEFSC